MSSPWTEHKVVPDVLTSEPPKQLSVSWGDVACNFQTLTPTDMQKEPTIDFDFEKGALYTIILTDPDAPSRADPKFGQWLHWLRVNVSSESAGDCLAQYVGAGPPQGTGLHRYVFLVYKQAGKCDAAKLTTHHCADQRPKWNAEAFVASLSGCSLEAGTFCQAEWDDYVPKLYKALETMGRNKVRSKRWLPLESNPELMNKYIHSLGVPEKFVLHEIYGVDEALLAMVPQPVYAVLMLFPISETSERHKAEEAKQSQTVSEEVYFIEQEIANACGTIGLIHAVLNNHRVLNLDPGKFFGKFLAQTKDADMATRVRSLNENTDIEVEHQALASEATSVIEHKSNANLHFNAFVKVAGDLYELDGRKKQPINHGKCENLLFDAANVVRTFMARDPNEIRWNLVALGPKE